MCGEQQISIFCLIEICYVERKCFLKMLQKTLVIEIGALDGIQIIVQEKVEKFFQEGINEIPMALDVQFVMRV